MLLPGKTHTSNTSSKEVWQHLCRKYYSTVTDPEGIHSAPAHSGVDLPKITAIAQMTKGKKKNQTKKTPKQTSSYGNNTYLAYTFSYNESNFPKKKKL